MLNDDSDRMVVWRYDITISSIQITIPFPIPTFPISISITSQSIRK